MPIRRGNLHRICERCEVSYAPNGKSQKICDKCFKKAMKGWQTDYWKGKSIKNE